MDRPRRAFRLRTPLTLMVLLALLVGASWYAVRELKAPPTLSPPGHCVPRAVPRPPVGRAGVVAAAQVRVTVFNSAGGRAGLATATSSGLEQRGFTTGAPGNVKDAVPGVGVVRAADRRLPSVALVLGQVPGATFQPITRHDASVDLVLGSRFTALARRFPTSVRITTRSAVFPADCPVPGLTAGQ